MAEIRYNNSLGQLGAPMGSTDTSITFTGSPGWATLTGSDYIKLEIDPPISTNPEPNANFEVVYVSAYTASASSATITRGEEGTTPVDHFVNATWLAGPTAADFNSGGGGGGNVTVHKAPFAYNLTGLSTGVAAPFDDSYVPAVGDLLLNAWIEIDTAWNGTTPKGDVGCDFTDGNGWFGNSWDVLDMTVVDVGGSSSWLGDAALIEQGGVTGSYAGNPSSLINSVLSSFFTGTTQPAPRYLPATFVAATAIQIVVSENGTLTGGSPGATQGAAILYVATATPT